ncbi:DNA mismatch repair protein MutS [Striga asiatica]|uniref:DNA mismatch repair protein MutS n=1 Tax=Striga asiatica TaxID=4170 RepID=A0A5A7PFJ4_STRAF|nr:DNA mismatch repair protein MutS [Striga asiatica]
MYARQSLHNWFARERNKKNNRPYLKSKLSSMITLPQVSRDRPRLVEIAAAPIKGEDRHFPSIVSSGRRVERSERREGRRCDDLGEMESLPVSSLPPESLTELASPPHCILCVGLSRAIASSSPPRLLRRQTSSVAFPPHRTFSQPSRHWRTSSSAFTLPPDLHHTTGPINGHRGYLRHYCFPPSPSEDNTRYYYGPCRKSPLNRLVFSACDGPHKPGIDSKYDLWSLFCKLDKNRFLVKYIYIKYK